MNLRPKEIYVSGKTKKRLYWLQQLEKTKMDDRGIVTMDEVAERLINEKIEQDYPDITKLEKRLSLLEEQMINELGEMKGKT